ncbi:structural protein [Komagataeibacter oboediens]|uniref:Structural protein n=1 Tax=Komagataeibacter oboediens TaxID=65958 RepID=A0ABS5SQX1_9PROT|nr:structural protein [Komagataeibacter oboediens]MBL7233395.1 structural protein [Komagataeibacter oboediens]MBT0676697.1 structural protein [Komagataeibacter oboediens]MBT0678222.1 structural protein [Komagataeibacter oboediens]
MSEKLPRGIRNNNPGNLNYAGQPGAHLETGVPHPRFAAFPTMADGIRALRDQLLRYGERGLTTVRAIISVYAPPSENPTGAYVYALCSHMGVQPDTVLDLRDPATMRGLIEGITTMENGPGHISLTQIDQALRAAPAPPQPITEA